MAKRTQAEIERDNFLEKLQAIIDRMNDKGLPEEDLRRDLSSILTTDVNTFAAMRDAQIWEEGAQAGLSVEDKENDPLPPNPYRASI